MMVLHGQITGTSPGSATTAAIGNPLHGMEQFDAIQIACEVQGGTGGTLDLYIQASWDNGTTWWDWAHLAQLAAGAAAIKYMVNAPNMGNGTVAPTVIGKNTTPALAVATVTGGLGSWGKSIRVLAVAGASTSAGAAQTFTVHGLRLKH